MHGSFGLLVANPMGYIVLASELVFLVAMLSIRYITEGRLYNPAYSSFIGIQFLIAIVIEAAYVLRHSSPSGIIASATFQWVIGGIAVLYAVRRIFVYDNPADKYHQLVVIPILIWLLGTTIPFLWTQKGQREQVIVSALLGIFAVLAGFDWATGRSKPRQYMLSRGVMLKGSYPPRV